MEDLGALLSQISNRPGDTLLLDGDLGAGKTCLSRGFVQTLVGDDQQRVTSPTYLLCNSYTIASSRDDVSDDDTNGAHQSPGTVHHMDLYRLSGKPDDLRPLNLDQVFTNDVSLIEWPQRLGSMVPTERLELTLEIQELALTDGATRQEESDDACDDEDEEEDCMPRRVTLSPIGKRWEDRITMIQEEGFVDDWIILLEE
eukprot:CAMPEP_0119018486 /NCGR_PEP_ID=MMETSP1176-20130426/19524_1 /TAXON_ID=265551 /ORGANISM="Synedropsis recta cf, Strain CCMP1620" /LENGTH=199 /DNA_ID=CAMNT_0006972503 /DNA_START=228 /DNA_END=827 /DNA_ORIENTATION=+